MAEKTACPPAPPPRVVTAIASIAVAAAAHAQQECHPWHAKIVNGYIALAQADASSQADAGNAAVAAFNAWAMAPQGPSANACAGFPGGWAEGLRIDNASYGEVDSWAYQAFRTGWENGVGVYACQAVNSGKFGVEFWQTYCPPAPPPPAPPPPPPPPPAPAPMPPLGCAYGEGGFTACITDTGVPPSTPPASTATDSGPGPNIGDSNFDTSPGPADPVPATDGTDTADGGGTCPTSVADPVFPGIGNTFQQEVDYRGPMGLNLVRRYNSSLPGWVHNFSVRVLANATTARVVRPDGRSHLFTGSGAGEWMDETATRERLIRLHPSDASQPAWQYLTAQDGSEWYDGQGRLMAFTRRGGLTYTAQQSGARLASVSDAFGHSLQFAYDARGRVAPVTMPENTTITYAYDLQGRLASVTYPDGTTRQYLYENAAYPLALTGLIDERGVRVDDLCAK